MNPLELMQIHPVFPAVVVDDADDDAMQTGDVISMENYEDCLILIAYGDGTATSGDIEVTVNQGTDIAFGTNKALNALQTGRIFEKVNAATLAAVGQWTEVTQAVADEVYTDADSGEECGMIALWVKASDLDVDNGYKCIRADLSAITSAKLVSAFYILTNPKYASAPDEMQSALR